jgi:CDP-diglyceride synthetase
MCGCFVVSLGAFFPRVAIILLWIFGPTVNAAFNDNFLVPFLGLILVPYTTLSYVLFYWWLGSVEGFTWFFIALAFVGDIGAWTAGARSRRKPTPVE